MKLGTAIWLIGWLFVVGLVGGQELDKNPDYKMGFKMQVKLIVMWPAVIGYYVYHKELTHDRI